MLSGARFRVFSSIWFDEFRNKITRKHKQVAWCISTVIMFQLVLFNRFETQNALVTHSAIDGAIVLGRKIGTAQGLPALCMLKETYQLWNNLRAIQQLLLSRLSANRIRSLLGSPQGLQKDTTIGGKLFLLYELGTAVWFAHPGSHCR